MNDTEIQAAITHHTCLRLAGLDSAARRQAARERLHEIAGMLELARCLPATQALIGFLERERA